MLVDKKCSNCIVYILSHNEQEWNCPCINCLIKTVCRNSCKRYIEFIDKIYCKHRGGTSE